MSMLNSQYNACTLTDTAVFYALFEFENKKKHLECIHVVVQVKVCFEVTSYAVPNFLLGTA